MKNRIFNINSRKHFVMLFVFLLTAILFVSCSEDDDPSGPGQSAEGENFLAVAGMSTLDLLNLETGEWLEEPLGLGIAPNCIIPNGNKLYVISSLSNELHVFQYADNYVTLELRVDIGLGYNRNPYLGALTENDKILITNLKENSVSVFNTVANSIDTLWDSGLSPEGIVVESDKAYVVNTAYNFNAGMNGHGYGSLYKYQIETGELLDTLALGLNPQFVDMDPYGNLHVICTGNYGDVKGQIYIIDEETFETIQIVDVDAYPGRITISADGIVWIAAGGWVSNGDESGRLIKYDTRTPENIEYISVKMGAIDVTLMEETPYVACFDDYIINEIAADTVSVNYVPEDQPTVLAIWQPTD